jgi:c(7)-type cytochrome triheme protein
MAFPVMGSNRSAGASHQRQWNYLYWLCTAVCIALPMKQGLAADPRHLPGGFQPASALPGQTELRAVKRLSSAGGNSKTTASPHDPATPDLDALQTAADAFASLPRNRRGAPDWMSALRQQAIQPRADVKGVAQPYLFDLDVIMSQTKNMPAVRFSHSAHSEWLTCANCHPKPFKPSVGTNPLRMADIFRGQSCGLCHGSVAFSPLRDCERCHSVSRKKLEQHARQ